MPRGIPFDRAPDVHDLRMGCGIDVPNRRGAGVDGLFGDDPALVVAQGAGFDVQITTS